eukprot:SAG22_NODE_13089_length_419_cov_1.128125_1_plen_57_part_01
MCRARFSGPTYAASSTSGTAATTTGSAISGATCTASIAIPVQGATVHRMGLRCHVKS